MSIDTPGNLPPAEMVCTCVTLKDLKRLALERFAKAASPDGDVIDVEAA